MGFGKRDGGPHASCRLFPAGPHQANRHDFDLICTREVKAQVRQSAHHIGIQHQYHPTQGCFSYAFSCLNGVATTSLPVGEVSKLVLALWKHHKSGTRFHQHNTTPDGGSSRRRLGEASETTRTFTGHCLFFSTARDTIRGGSMEKESDAITHGWCCWRQLLGGKSKAKGDGKKD